MPASKKDDDRALAAYSMRLEARRQSGTVPRASLQSMPPIPVNPLPTIFDPMKYPRTPHLPHSPGCSKDDRKMADLGSFKDRYLIVTEKLDGSNVCLQADGCFARSHVEPPRHPSFDMFKAFHASVKHLIKPGFQIFGEWLYAKHSIRYTGLPNYFMVFGVHNMAKHTWESWTSVDWWAQRLGVPTVPVLHETTPTTDLEAVIRKFAAQKSSKYGGSEREGFVVRWADSFADEEFETAVAKWVRKDHVQTPDHWKNQMVTRNRLEEES